MMDTKGAPSDDRMTQPRRRFRGWYVVLVGAFILAITSVASADLGDGGSPSLHLWLLALLGNSLPAILLLPFIGRAVDRWGPRRAAMWGLSIIGGGFVLHLGAGIFGILLLGNAVLALGYRMAAELPMTVMVSNWFARRRATALAFMQMPSVLGFGANVALGVGVGFAELVSTGLGLLITGAFFLVLAWPISRLVRNRPEDYGLHPDGRNPDLSSGHVQPASDYGWREALVSRSFWLLAAGGCAMAFASTWAFYIAFLSTERGISTLQSGLIMMLASVVAIPFALVGGFLGDRLPIRRVLSGFAVVLAATMLVTAFAHTLPLFLISAVLFGIGSGAMAVLPLAAVAMYFGRRNLGTVLGCYLCVVNLVGSFSHVVVGLLLSSGGSTVLSLFFGFISVVGALAYLLMGELRTAPKVTCRHTVTSTSISPD